MRRIINSTNITLDGVIQDSRTACSTNCGCGSTRCSLAPQRRKTCCSARAQEPSWSSPGLSRSTPASLSSATDSPSPSHPAPARHDDPGRQAPPPIRDPFTLL
jgi:hypothetical protein